MLATEQPIALQICSEARVYGSGHASRKKRSKCRRERGQVLFIVQLLAYFSLAGFYFYFYFFEKCIGRKMKNGTENDRVTLESDGQRHTPR